MTPVFCCGGECGAIYPYSGTPPFPGGGPHWVKVGGAADPTIVSTGQRSGSRCIKVNTSNQAGGLYCVIDVAAQVVVVRLYIYFTTLPDASCELFAFRMTGSGRTIGLGFDSSDNTLKKTVSAVAGGSGFVVTTGRWYRVDFRANLSANPWLTDFSVDGTAVAQSSDAIDADTLSYLLVGDNASNRTTNHLIDDIVISVTSGDYPIGAGYINHFVPTSDGTHNVAGANDFERGTTGTDIINSTTDSYLLVNDVPMDDTTPDADDSIGCIAPPNSTDYTENVFGPASGISTPTTGPRAVEVCYAHHEAGTGTGVSSAKLNDNGTEDSVYSLSGAGATTTRYARKHYATMVGGGAWTAARFNNLRIRFGYSSDANPDQFFDCAMIEAEFAPATSIKTLQGVTYDSSNVKTVQGLAIASVKTIQGTA